MGDFLTDVISDLELSGETTISLAEIHQEYKCPQITNGIIESMWFYYRTSNIGLKECNIKKIGDIDEELKRVYNDLFVYIFDLLSLSKYQVLIFTPYSLGSGIHRCQELSKFSIFKLGNIFCFNLNMGQSVENTDIQPKSHTLTSAVNPDLYVIRLIQLTEIQGRKLVVQYCNKSAQVIKNAMTKYKD